MSWTRAILNNVSCNARTCARWLNEYSNTPPSTLNFCACFLLTIPCFDTFASYNHSFVYVGASALINDGTAYVQLDFWHTMRAFNTGLLILCQARRDSFSKLRFFFSITEGYLLIKKVNFPFTVTSAGEVHL